MIYSSPAMVQPWFLRQMLGCNRGSAASWWRTCMQGARAAVALSAGPASSFISASCKSSAYKALYQLIYPTPALFQPCFLWQLLGCTRMSAASKWRMCTQGARAAVAPSAGPASSFISASCKSSAYKAAC